MALDHLLHRQTRNAILNQSRFHDVVVENHHRNDYENCHETPYRNSSVSLSNNENEASDLSIELY